MPTRKSSKQAKSKAPAKAKGVDPAAEAQETSANEYGSHQPDRDGTGQVRQDSDLSPAGNHNY